MRRFDLLKIAAWIVCFAFSFLFWFGLFALITAVWKP